ncbi:MAG: hypothetical protein ACI9A0_002456, partial [Pseudoalteromonas tetraodonis]
LHVRPHRYQVLHSIERVFALGLPAKSLNN